MNFQLKNTSSPDDITRDWLKVLGSNGVQILFSFVTGLLLARILKVDHYGYFNVIISFIAVGGAISDLGLTASASYHIPDQWKKSLEQAVSLGRVYFWLRVLYSALLAALIGLSAYFIIPIVGSIGLPLIFIQLAAIAVVANAVNDGMKTFLQVDADFNRYSLLTITGAAVTCGLTGILAISRQLNLTSAIFFLLIVKEMVIVVIGYLWIHPRWSIELPSTVELKRGWKRLTRSGVWIWLANIIEKLGIRMDLLIIPFWLSSWQVGIYALSFNLSRRLSTVNHNLYTVVLPKTSNLDSRERRRQFIRKSLGRSTWISLLILGVILAADPLIPLVYGTSYATSANLFQWLAAIVILEVYLTPFLLLFYSVRKENEKTIAEAIKTFILFILLLILLPYIGLMGIILARFVATGLSGAYTVYRTHKYW